MKHPALIVNFAATARAYPMMAGEGIGSFRNDISGSLIPYSGTSPKIRYNYFTQKVEGLALEGSLTNYIINNYTYSPSWTHQVLESSTPPSVLNKVNGFDGTNSGLQLKSGASASLTAGFYQVTRGTAVETHVSSGFVRNNSPDPEHCIYFVMGQWVTNGNSYHVNSIINRAKEPVNTPMFKLGKAKDGWMYYELKGNNITAGNINSYIGIWPRNASGGAVNNSANNLSIDFCNQLFTRGDISPLPIATYGGEVSKAADSCSIPVSEVTRGGELTLIVKARISNLATALLNLSNAAGTKRLCANTGTNYSLTLSGNVVTASSVIAKDSDTHSTYVIRVSKTNTALNSYWVNGYKHDSNGAAVDVSDLSNLILGSATDAALGISIFDSLYAWNSALSDEEITRLTSMI